VIRRLLWTKGLQAASALKAGHGQPPILTRGAQDKEVLERSHTLAAPQSGLQIEPRVGGPTVWSFLALVVAPALAISVYFGFIAADQYEATSKFIMREIAVAPLSITKDAKPTSGYSAAGPSQFASVAVSYIQSAAILNDLAADGVNVRAILQNSRADWLTRLPRAASSETLLEHWRNHVRVSLDRGSGIVRLRVRAFDPEEARTLNAAILQRTEALANTISRQQREDALVRAEAEAAAAQARLREATFMMSSLRDTEGLISPQQEAVQTLAQMTMLSTELFQLDAELRTIQAMIGGDSPRSRQLTLRRGRLAADIATLRIKIAGEATADANLAAAVGRFEELEVRRTVATRLYEITEGRRLEARIELSQPVVYLHAFEPPTTPDEARYPERLALTGFSILGLLATWGTLALVYASIEDHRLA